MSAFVNHHRDSIRFDYSCFDRMLVAGYIQALQRGGQIGWYLKHRRGAASLGRSCFATLSQNYRLHVEELARNLGLDILEPDREQRREDLVAPYFRDLPEPGIAVILKAREPERIAVSDYRHHIDLSRRWVMCYTFYLRDADLGRMSLRICPYFPFNVSVCLNGHEYLACQLSQQNIGFRQCDNSFLDCEQPQRLQELADSFDARAIYRGLDPWLARLLPYFDAAERADGYRHHLVMRQVEYCHNIVFHKKAGLNKLFDRMMDHAHALGHPQKLAVIFGRSRVQVDARTGEVERKVTVLRTPVLRASLEKTTLKQYVKEGALLRTESASFQMKELSLPKGIQHLPRVRTILGQCNERFQDVQQDILETYVDRGQLQELCQPTVTPGGRRTPGLRPQDPRLLAVLQALLAFVHLVGKGCFTTKALLPDVHKAFGNPEYKLSQLRYDLGKLRGKGMVHRLAGTQRYQLTPAGYRLAVLYLKLYQRFYAPLTAAIVEPFADDNRVLTHRTAKLDRLYQAVDRTLKDLCEHVGIPA
jgi:hypothetical protein